MSKKIIAVGLMSVRNYCMGCICKQVWSSCMEAGDSTGVDCDFEDAIFTAVEADDERL